MEAGRRTLVRSLLAAGVTSLLVRREHAGVPQTSKQQLEEMTVGKLRRSVVRTCERNGVREHSRFKRSVPLEMGI